MTACLPFKALIYTIKKTQFLTFNALLVINRIFYTVVGVLYVLAVSLLTSIASVPKVESFLNSQYIMNIHNKVYASQVTEEDSWIQKGFKVFGETP